MLPNTVDVMPLGGVAGTRGEKENAGRERQRAVGEYTLDLARQGVQSSFLDAPTGDKRRCSPRNLPSLSWCEVPAEETTDERTDEPTDRRVWKKNRTRRMRGDGAVARYTELAQASEVGKPRENV